MSNPRRILVIRLSSVGDVVLATGVVDVLKRLFPEARLDFLVDQGYAPLVQHHPELDQVFVFEAAGRHRGPGGIHRLAEEIGAVDLVVDLQHKLRSAMLTHLLKPSEKRVLVKRGGLGLVRAMLGRDSVLGAPHQLERYIKVAMGEAWREGISAVPKLVMAPEALSTALEELGLGDAPLGFVVGARHASKRWPVAHWSALLEKAHSSGLSVVLLGGPADAELAKQVAQGAARPPHRIWVDGDLGQLAARLALCRLLVCADSGPAHMAAAIGRPVVALFGSTSPERWTPVGSQVQVLRQSLGCSPCSNHGSDTCPLDTFACMRELSPERVWEAVRHGLED
ncbi:MAG: lipopolysaccharide heptosyltransferase II [Deltaproteobacteria bacterium]|nr:lipopolysaccharide heptosyltransferase II [Deltaproteobacteria bacterium]